MTTLKSSISDSIFNFSSTFSLHYHVGTCVRAEHRREFYGRKISFRHGNIFFEIKMWKASGRNIKIHSNTQTGHWADIKTKGGHY